MFALPDSRQPLASAFHGAHGVIARSAIPLRLRREAPSVYAPCSLQQGVHYEGFSYSAPQLCPPAGGPVELAAALPRPSGGGRRTAGVVGRHATMLTHDPSGGAL